MSEKFKNDGTWKPQLRFKGVTLYSRDAVPELVLVDDRTGEIIEPDEPEKELKTVRERRQRMVNFLLNGPAVPENRKKAEQ